MAITSVADLVGVVRESRLLDPPQQDALTCQLQGQFADPKALAKALVDRGWLTAFQVKKLANGRGTELIVGQYVLLDVLGEGGMGQVFKAKHRGLGRTVALKVVRKEWLANPAAVRRFQREIRAASQLNHPNIVLALDADQMGQTHFIAMEYIEGMDLAKLVKQQGPLPAGQACDYACQAALGLQHAHERGFVHRDVKPSNLLVTQDPKQKQQATQGGRRSGLGGGEYRWGLLKILDMGVARATQGDQTDMTGTLTHAGAVLGTPDYISPEQARDSRSVDIRSDIYSLGCTLYFLLAGRVPFPGGTGMEKLFKHQLEAPPPLEQLRDGLPKGLAKLVARLMAKKPEDRPQTPAEAAKVLLPFVQADTSSPASIQASQGFVGADALEPTLDSQKPEDSTPHLTKRKRTSGLAASGLVPAPSDSPPRRFPRWLMWSIPLGAAAGLLLAVGLGLAVYFAGSGGKPTASGQTGPGDPGKAQAPLDQLDANRIPPSERLADLPPEVVAVLGQHRFRHWGAVQGAAFSPDGKQLATAGGDRVVRLWDRATGQQQKVISIEGAGFGIQQLAYSPNGQALIVLLLNQNVRVFDVASGKSLGMFPGGKIEGRPIGLAPGGQYVIFASNAGHPQLWDVVRQEQRGQIAGIGATHAMVVSHDGKTVASWTRGGMGGDDVIIWDAATGAQRSRLTPGKGGAMAVALAPDGQTAAVLTDSSVVHLYNTATGAETFRQETPGRSFSLAYSPDGKTLAVGATDQVRLFDLARGKPRALAGTTNGVGNGQASAFVFSPDSGVLLVLGSWEPVVRMWDTASGEELHHSEGGSGGFVNQLTIVEGGRGLVVSGGFGRPRVKLWDIPSGKVRTTFGDPGGSMLLGIGADSQTVVTRSMNSLTLWDFAGGTQKKSVLAGAQGPQQFMQAGATADGSVIFTHAQNSNQGKIWDGTTLQERGTIEGLKNVGFNTISFSANGQRLALGEFQGVGGGEPSGRVRLWDTTALKELPVNLTGIKGAVLSVVMSPDGRLVAAGAMNGLVKLWDAETGQERLSYQDPAPPEPGPGPRARWGYMLQFAPDGQTLLGWNNQHIKVWDSASGRERATVKAPRDVAAAAVFSPDSKFFAASDRSGRIAIWNAAGGSEVRHIQLAGPAAGLAFAGDGRHLITSNANGTIYVLRLAGSP
jgi:serine/threonine-protein kinase